MLLVTHFMEEAERLCDRVALIDSGRLVALDRPGELAAGVGSEQQIRFRPSHPFDPALLTGLPEVSAVTAHGAQLVVTGTGELLSAVVSALAREGIVTKQLRVVQTNLEDAFVALTPPRAPSRRAIDKRAGS